METSKNNHSYQDLLYKLQENYNELFCVQKETKKHFYNILKNNHFEDKYYVADLPIMFIKYDFPREVILCDKDLAYILYRHNNSLSLDDFSRMPEVIENFNVVCKGTRNNNDLCFLKLFKSDNGKFYALEVILEKKQSTDSNEYVVHFLHIGRSKNKALKKYNEYLTSNNIIAIGNDII